jgi:hypothetical protein
MSNCFPLNSSYSEISNNKYIFNNLFTNISYGLYDTSNNFNYIIRNVSKNYPLTFYDSCVNSLNSSVSNILAFEPLNKNDPILIYVSKGQDYSFNNNDYFRFYDSSFQLLNINHSKREIYDSSLTDIVSNLYFMNNQRYKFIATTDFCSNQPFRIYGNSPLTIDNSLSRIGASFELTIPYNADNSINRLFYSDINTDNTNDVCGNLFILRDSSYSYYYGDISFSIKNYNDFSRTYISVKSYDYSYSTVSGYGTVSISNNNLFYYSDYCSYITQGYSRRSYELLNKISAIDLSVNANNTFKVGLNKNRHISNSTFNYDLSYGLTIKDYIIIDISKNYPLRLLNNEISNNIYIDETYQINRLGIHTISGSKYYYGSLKIKVSGSFIDPLKVQFISLSNNNIDFSYILTFIYDRSNNPLTLNHIVYDSSSNSRSYYDFSNSNLQVKNQNNVYYDLSSYDISSNIFNLNLNTDYNELGYVSRDKLAHDLTQFVSASPSIDQINNELSNNFLDRPFYIYYNVIDYENNYIQNIRAINLNAGPIIEISNNYNYNNNNNNNSVFAISINTNSNNNASIYNFYDDIKVYIYDKSKNKIFIPFEITISGSYFQNNRTPSSISKRYEFNTYLTISEIQYYPTFIDNITLNTNNNTLTLSNIDLTSISVYNISNSLVDQISSSNTTNSIVYLNQSTDISLNSSNLNFISSIRFLKPLRFEFNTNNSYVNNSFDSSFIVYNFTYTITNPSKTITISLGLSPTKFFFTASDNSVNSFTVSGNFVKPKIFKQATTDSSLIDLSYIGNYDLTINTKSLNSLDYFKETYVDKFFTNSIINKSKTYKINVQDISAPILTFYDISGRLLTNLTYFKLFYPKARKFNIYNDICFAKLANFTSVINEYVDNKPVLLYDENSIYDLCTNDLSYSVTIPPPLTTTIIHTSNGNDISLNNFSVSDPSCIINYRVRDLCNNYSTGISLELNFVNIPYVNLLGQSIVVLNYVNDLSYSDKGLDFIDPSFTYIPRQSYNKTNTISPLTDFSFFIIGSLSTVYSVSGTCDICFTSLGNYYFKYNIQQSDSTHVLRLQRLIKVVDSTKPFIIFPDLSFTIDGSSGSLPERYNTIENSRTKSYSFDNSAGRNIDISFTVKTKIHDLSRVLYNFDLCDNYFNASNLSYTIKLANKPNAFALADISNYYSPITEELNKVTYPDNSSNVNYLAPLTFVYTLTDGCANSFIFNRRVNIVDEGKPTIRFTFNNIYTTANILIDKYIDYSYVQFDSSKNDFSYVAFDYTRWQSSLNSSKLILDFYQEISSIILGFDLSDNFGIIEKTASNVSITVSGSILTSPNNKISIANPTDNSNINALFKVIGSSFSLIYDISDNQTNSIREIRNVKIVEYIGDPGLNFEFGYKQLVGLCNELVNISFGDTSFNINDISVNHNRLTSSDISYDICYIFVNPNINANSSYINSISGTSLRRYDPSALIYNLGPQGRSEFSHNILYFPIRANISISSFSTIINYKFLTVTVKNNGPNISFGPNPIINHQSYTPINDASFIFGVTSYSKYDEFYYYNYNETISYSGTNFKVILDSSLNINDPSSGTYSIIYYSKDSNNVDISTIRILRVTDSQAPVIRSICGDNIYQTSNTVWSLERYSTYIEYGALVYDSATKRSYYFDNQTIPTSIESVYDFSYKILGGIKYSIRYNELISTSISISYSPITFGSINTSIIDICYQVIYSILDLCNNEVSANRIIKIIQNYRPLLYPYIEVNSNSQVLTKYLLRDLSNNDISFIQINNAIPRIGNNGGINDISYDLSLSYINNNSTKIITCEAIKPIVFNRVLNSNYIKFKLDAKSYDESRVNFSGTTNSLLRTYVDYSINSIKIFNSPIDYQPITFTAIDSCQNSLEQQQSITFYLKIIDTKPPNVIKLTNINFSDINKLDYPLLSLRAISKLVDNINYFDTYENSYLNYIKYYKQVRSSGSDVSNIVLLDPGINIDDIVNGSVNFVGGLFESSGHTFSTNDISLTYFKDPSYIDVSNVLTIMGQYIQNYNVKDNAKNAVDVSRVIVVKPFGPIIRLNYQQDSAYNNYTCYLLQRYEKFIEKEGIVRDFSDIDISFTNVTIDYSNLNENKDGSYIVVYSATNSSNVLGTAKRNVEVYSPIVLEKTVSNNFVNLISGLSNFNNNSKFSLGIGIYNFDVCANYAFKLVTRDFDTSMVEYDVSNLISLTGDASYISVNNETYYYGSNVRLTISGDFERCSLKFYPDTSSSRVASFQSYLKANEFRYFFIYDNANYFINLQNYYNNLRDPTQNIDISNSFSVDVSNLNNPLPGSGQYFTINGLKQDLHLAYGVYRFQQTSYKNFYNPIKFSTTPDGTHQGGTEYTKTVFSQNLPGVSRPSLASYNTLSIYTQISINATTPTILYYYSEKFKNMGGKIVVKNNIVFLKNVIILNSHVITDTTKDLFSVGNTFLQTSNVVMRNRIVLNQRFEASANRISVNSTSAINICCVTQQNLQYNVLYDLNRHPNRLIFKNYNDPSTSNYIIPQTGSTNGLNYLISISNTDLTFYNSYNSYITYFNSIYESSSVIIKANGLTNYDRSLKNVFYNSAYTNSPYTINTNSNDGNTINRYDTSASLLNNEIINYITFFKRNNVLSSKLLVKDFSYNVSEFLFAKQAALLNLDSTNMYNYNSPNSSFLIAPRIKITNIVDNYVMFSIDVYYANLRFQTFEFIVYSSSFTTFPNPSSTISNDRLFFLNGSLVIANNMLYSNANDISGFYDGSSVFNKMYINSNVRETTMKNMVFLNIIDVSLTSSICGITKQNIYNNMYLDESNNFIFHKYNEQTIVNYQVNDANLTLAKTLIENSNNDHYLLDVCSNNFYNSFNNDGLTIQSLNSLVNNNNYSIALTYKIYDEIDVSINFNMLASFYILPIYLNNIPTYRRINNVFSTEYNYNSGSYSITKNGIISEISINAISSIMYGNYNTSSTSNLKTIVNGLHSNSYIINLNDYFDIDLVANRFQETSFNTNIINPNNLIYTIDDINYNNNKFNLYNVETSYNIIFDKLNLTTLNSMQLKLFCLYFKLKYLDLFINNVYSTTISINANNPINPINSINSIPYINSVNIQYYSDLYANYDIVNTSFTSTLATSTISILYTELLNNTISLITFYNKLLAKFKLVIYNVITPPIFGTYILSSSTITQLERDINSLVENIDFVILNENSKVEFTLISSILSGTIFTSYSDINAIEYTLVSFIELYNKSQSSFARMNSSSSSTYIYELFNSSNFINLFDITNLNPSVFLSNFKANLDSLNAYISTNLANIPESGGLLITSNNGPIILDLFDVTSFTQFLCKINLFKDGLTNLLNIYIGLEVAPNNINYSNKTFELSGSQLLIHSIVSNSINIKINIKYKSYFFNYIDISTILLDIIIPDLTPPVLTFANHDFSFNQTDLVPSSINNVVTNLIRDVSYIDLHQSYDLSINNTNYSYYTDITNAPSTNNIENSLVSIELPKIKNTDFISTSALYIDIIYIVKDNANNINTINRKLIINKSNDGPKFYYYKASELEYQKLSNTSLPPTLTIDDNITVTTLKAELTNLITLIDPRLSSSDIYLQPYMSKAAFDIFYSRAIVGIDVINIYDSLRSTIPYATYDVSNNRFIDYFNYTTQGGQELANISKILLDIGTYTLEYISRASTITNSIASQSRTLIVNAAIIPEEVKPIVTHCCYPKVEYKPIQDNYKLGSQNSTVMKRVKYIINRNR